MDITVDLPTLLYPKDILLSDGRPDKQIDSNPITKLMQSDIRWAASVIIARLPANQPPINWVIWKGRKHIITKKLVVVVIKAIVSFLYGHLMSLVMYIL